MKTHGIESIQESPDHVLIEQIVQKHCPGL